MPRKTLIAVLKAVKGCMPLKVRLLFRPVEAALQKLIFGRQHLMVLMPERALPELKLKDGVTISSFRERPDKDAWVRLVNGTLGEWDGKTAEAFFFNDKAFIPELCLFIFSGGRLAGTATGRVIEKNGKRTGEVHMVSVLPEFRGMGLGYAITLSVLHLLREKVDGEIILRTDLWRTPAVKTYKRLGFTAA